MHSGYVYTKTQQWLYLNTVMPHYNTHHSDHCSVLFFSCPRSEGWPHYGCTFSIYLYPLSFWLTLPQGVLSTSWCCLSRPCVVFLACVHLALALFLALFLSPDNSLVSSWYDHNMLASLLWQSLTVASLQTTRLLDFISYLISYFLVGWSVAAVILYHSTIR